MGNQFTTIWGDYKIKSEHFWKKKDKENPLLLLLALLAFVCVHLQRALTTEPLHTSGYLLANDAQGETPLIPSEVMEFSIKHSTEVDINTTLQILGSPGEKASSIPGCNRTDSVIR